MPHSQHLRESSVGPDHQRVGENAPRREDFGEQNHIVATRRRQGPEAIGKRCSTHGWTGLGRYDSAPARVMSRDDSQALIDVNPYRIDDAIRR